MTIILKPGEEVLIMAEDEDTQLWVSHRVLDGTVTVGAEPEDPEDEPEEEEE